MDGEAAVAAAVRDAAEAGTTLEVRGGGSKRAAGRPATADAVLDVSGLAGIVEHQPEELVMVARPGTPLADVTAALAAHGQMLAFEPPDWGRLLGGPSAWGTLGGAVAVNAGGPRRFAAGAARDHVLGVRAVNGRGEVFHSGGRVVKNVTGYDLSKVLTGSWGTLAVLTEIVLKVLPAPEHTRTLRVPGLDDDAALALLRGVAGGPHAATGLAHRPGGGTDIRVEGAAVSVEHRAGALRDQLGGDLLDHDPWPDTRDAAPLAHWPVLWRASVPPAAALALVDAARPDGHLYDHAGGRVWLGYAEASAAQADRIRAAVAGGHAMLVRAPATVRAEVAVFHPLAPALAALSARVKASFDPRGVFNPGRMWDGG